MPRTSAETKADILTFRLPPALKADLAALAQKEAKPIGALLRELIRARVKQEERREFEAEARRACDILNAAAQDPTSDEAHILRELDTHLDSLAAEWQWEE